MSGRCQVPSPHELNRALASQGLFGPGTQAGKEQLLSLKNARRRCPRVRCAWTALHISSGTEGASARHLSWLDSGLDGINQV